MSVVQPARSATFWGNDASIKARASVGFKAGASVGCLPAQLANKSAVPNPSRNLIWCIAALRYIRQGVWYRFERRRNLLSRFLNPNQNIEFRIQGEGP
jgi:hypothetical protein